MRAGIIAAIAALNAAAGILLWTGWPHGGIDVMPEVTLLASATQPSAGQQSPEEWIRSFDRRRERLLDRLDGRLEELRRRLQRVGGPEKLLATCG